MPYQRTKQTKTNKQKEKSKRKTKTITKSIIKEQTKTIQILNVNSNCGNENFSLPCLPDSVIIEKSFWTLKHIKSQFCISIFGSNIKNESIKQWKTKQKP